MRSKGSRFTLGVWGLRVCSPDVAQPSATVRNRSQPFATVRNRSREDAMAVPMGEAAKEVIFGRFRRVTTSFRVAGVALRGIPMCFKTCRKSFCVAGAILSRRFQKLSCIFRGRRSALEVSIVIFHGRRSILDVSCCVVFADRIVRAASRSENVQIVWQEWHFVRCDVETPLSMGEAAKVMLLWCVETPLSMREAAKVMMYGVKSDTSLARNARFQPSNLSSAVYEGSCKGDDVWGEK
eukprot:s143_g15.t1